MQGPQRFDDALDTMVKVRKRNKKSPINAYYLGVISDRRGNAADAKYYYKEYLKLNHPNKEMNDNAKKRLEKMNYDAGRKMGEKIGGGIFTILKEMSTQ